MASNSVINEETIVTASEGHVKSTVGDEVVVLDVEEGVYYGLNEVGATVWELIQEPQSVNAIVETLLEEYTVERETCVSDVMELLDQLHENGLITLR